MLQIGLLVMACLLMVLLFNLVSSRKQEELKVARLKQIETIRARKLKPEIIKKSKKDDIDTWFH